MGNIEQMIEIRYKNLATNRVFTMVMSERDPRYKTIMEAVGITVLDVKVVGRWNGSSYKVVMDDPDSLTKDDFKVLIDAALDMWDLEWAADLTRRLQRTTYMSRQPQGDEYE